MDEILTVKNLNVSYKNIQILKNINISIKRHEILGIVGESGSGKSTFLKSLVMLGGKNLKINNGSIVFNNKEIINLSDKELRNIRGKEIGTIFQNAGASLCPIRKIKKQFEEALKAHEDVSKEEIKERIEDIFQKINLKDTERILNSYPFELSGGMNQRVGIALAMIKKPELILADEPTSALDVTSQAKVAKSLINIRNKFGTSIIIVTHNIAVVSFMADNIAVMYGGNIVEYGKKEDIISNPMHPYTRALIKATPKMNSEILDSIPGNPPSLNKINKGCIFAERCSYKTDKCNSEIPSLKKFDNRILLCNLYDDAKEENIV